MRRSVVHLPGVCAGANRELSKQIERVVGRTAALVRSQASCHGLAGSEVDELLQDVRIRLWRALRTADAIAVIPDSYVYRTARSGALDMIRRRRWEREEPLEAAVAAAAHSSPDAGRVGTRQVIDAAVDRLIDSRRTVVRMYLAGYRMSEIAETLGWSSHRTRNLLYRGLRDLRNGLTAAGYGPALCRPGNHWRSAEVCGPLHARSRWRTAPRLDR